MRCLSRSTHRVVIENGRLLALDERGVTFRWKDYRDTRPKFRGTFLDGLHPMER
jgi:hypothetical protein